jgi:hypothetical protein
MKYIIHKIIKPFFFLLLVGCLGLSSCIKKSGCEYVEGDIYTGRFLYHKDPLDRIGSNVHAELEFEYNGGETGIIYFDGFIPKEFRTEDALQVILVAEPIGYFHYDPIYHKIKCIEKID